jgi:flagellar hook protein FlgE
MLKSLYSGVSGLQAHQIAMDVESNNIANVNTTGFKYSRANFSDLLSQTSAIATAPQGDIGGKNPVQVGLGSTVSSTTRIFAQGSIQNTDKNTDVAIQGDGFFIVSPDGGNTYNYTRAGDFKFDAAGNFVDNNGFVAQGWLRDPVTGKVDSTAPIQDIQIDPGLTTPANPTSEVVLKANLNSGDLVESYSPAYQVPSGTAPGEALDSHDNPITSGDMGVMFNETGEALSLQDGQGVWISFLTATTIGSTEVSSSDPLNLVLQDDDGNDLPAITAASANTGDADADQDTNGANYADAINQQTAITGISASYDPDTNYLTLTNDNSSDTAYHNVHIAQDDAGSGFAASDSVTTAYRYEYNSVSSTTAAGGDKTFKTISDLRYEMEQEANSLDLDGDGNLESDIKISVNDQGKFEITNSAETDDSYAMNIKITPMHTDTNGNSVTTNTNFTTSMQSLNSVLPVGSTGVAYSQSFNAATHSSSIDIFDSLGSKHTLRMEFRKVSVDPATGSTWDMLVNVPEPGTIDTLQPLNEKRGSIRFNNDGSLSTYSPTNISFTANNGSAPNQQVNLEFGTANQFDGMTSFDSRSATSGISQDGYTGGDLVGIRIDQSGTLVGSFSNGRSFGLAQLGMAKFTNNEGLSVEGGNLFTQTANSGDPIIGTAATAGRGFIQASALEGSNVDLSKSLTNLIIIQRGYEANGKTITTSDEMLQTLLGLKR